MSDEDEEIPSAAESMTASSASFVTKSHTGFQKPLRMGRLRRMWASAGLATGRRLATVISDDHVVLILMAAVVGIVSGVAAGALLSWIEYAVELFPDGDEGSTAVRYAVVLGVPVLGGLLAGGLRLLAGRVMQGPLAMGVPAVIEAIATRGGDLRGRGALIVGAGTGITIGSGGSCGHEGPSVAIGSSFR
jgi:CIC family chloride channel protein